MEESFLRRSTASLIPPVPNPFSNEAPWTPYEMAKAGAVACLLLPTRLAVLAWCGFMEVGIARVVAVGTEMREERGCYYHDEPFPLWRRWLLAPMAPVNRLALLAFGFWPGSIRVNDMRKSKAKTANLLVVAPHLTFLDSFLVAVAFPPVPSGVGISSILQYPVMRSLAFAGQAILVDRSNKESRHCCKEILEARAGPAWYGPPVMVFPEGVITNGKALVQFKLGAFSAGQPVTPVCLKYPWRHYNPSGCGKNCSMPIAVVRMLLQFANYCEIDILDTYVPSDAERDDPKLFADNVRKAMAEQLGVPLTEQSYEDSFLAFESKAHVGSDFEVAPLKELYDCSYENLRTLLRAFEQLDASGSGAIGYEDFARAIQSTGFGQARGESSSARLFAFFDQDRSGGIEFREFVQMAALLSGRCSPVSCAKLAFLLYDVRGTSRVQRGLLQRAAESSPARRAAALSSEESAPGRQLLEEAGVEEELDFEGFSQLAEAQPVILEAVLEPLRNCLGMPVLGTRWPEQDCGKKQQ